MVAETATDATQKPLAKRGRPPIHRVSLIQRSKARTLYIVEQLSYREISEQTGIPPRVLQNMAYRENWTNAKKSTLKSVEEKSLARIKEQVDEVVSAVALQTEELSLGTLAKARVTLDREDVNAARDLQAYSQAAKNFVGIARQARGLDSELRTDRNGQTLVFVKLERVGDASTPKRLPEPATEVNVTPVIETKNAPDSPKLT